MTPTGADSRKREPVLTVSVAFLLLPVRALSGVWCSEAPKIGKTVIRSSLLVGIALGAAASEKASDALDVEPEDAIAFGGPSSIVGQLEADRASKASLVDVGRAMRPLRDLNERLNSDYGITLGLDYNALYQYASESLDRQHAAGGVLRFYGTAKVVDQIYGHPGAIEFKVENRHRLGTDVAPSALAGQIGYAVLTAVPFSDAGTILTNLYWHQSLADNRLAYILGIVDVTDYVGVYGLVNPWTEFLNLAFSTDPTTPAPDQGLGAAMRWNPTERLYILVGLADANGDPSDSGNSINTFFGDGEYFKHIEAGWFGDWDTRFEDNIHLTLWHADERKEAAIPDGWGMQFSFIRRIGAHWLPFLRLGYGDGGGAPLEHSISVGFSYDGLGDDTVLGLGLNRGQPNGNLLEAATDDQYTVEAFARLQVFPRFAITPDIQLIKNPASNPKDDLIWVAGLRARLSF